MSTFSSNRSELDWRDRTHQLDFSESELHKLQKLEAQLNKSLHDVVEDLVVNNMAFKIKSVEFYSSYTFSITLPKDHPTHALHNWWFYDTEVGRGIRVMYIFVQEMLEDYLDTEVAGKGKSLWYG